MTNERDDRIRSHFRHQGDACEQLGSPFTAALCQAAAETLGADHPVGAAILGWPGNPREDALALRFCGALHALVLSGRDPLLGQAYPPATPDKAALARLIPAVLARHAGFILASLESAPQTNEIARSGMLLPGFLTIARETGLPLRLLEIGASAGLNMLFDRFHYRYGDREWGNAASPVSLSPELRGAAVPLDASLEILSRKGCDRSPIDIDDKTDRLRLRSYVWPDQSLRLARLDAAIELAPEVGYRLEKADAADFARANLATAEPGAATVLFHSIMWQYIPDDTKRAIEAAVFERARQAGQSAPLAWLRMEPVDTRDPYATLSLDLWPGGQTRRLARCDYHGRWIEWLG